MSLDHARPRPCFSRHLLSMALALAAIGCDPDSPCDPGQYEHVGACYPLPTDGSDAGKADDDAGDEAAACTPGPGHYDGFGDACETDDDCGCIAPRCAPTLKYCTRPNCETGADICPPTFACTDVSAVTTNPAVTHVCFKR